ncbi:hypothetical protein JCM19314_2607 [Nonlabens ulvanivorans]|uniref:Uncharacterized protein n=1 Tax=Nonlabens ulvanivorans TaxID=906888 RepID=A0A081D707_NONUL|nr:hypothetical protein JCM19296_281 [Nonlabens ulvanivorans]GAK88141.1 hypothetical protein JCM19297_2654 [Nonlabens ulvanivorans]GAK92375.1 hypothetical protein JCM19298_2863 [Nonlabens ulvanivorans]GAK98576.1 hypothetical protein JCM19314_2607 [Nonlabens ulvanivorans]
MLLIQVILVIIRAVKATEKLAEINKNDTFLIKTCHFL